MRCGIVVLRTRGRLMQYTSESDGLWLKKNTMIQWNPAYVFSSIDMAFSTTVL